MEKKATPLGVKLEIISLKIHEQYLALASNLQLKENLAITPDNAAEF